MTDLLMSKMINVPVAVRTEFHLLPHSLLLMHLMLTVLYIVGVDSSNNTNTTNNNNNICCKLHL